MNDPLGDKLIQSSADFAPDIGAVAGIKRRRKNRRNAGAATAAVVLLIAGVGVANRTLNRNSSTEIEFATSVPTTVETPTATEIATPDPDAPCPAVDRSRRDPLMPEAVLATYDALADTLDSNCNDFDTIAAFAGDNFATNPGASFTPADIWRDAVAFDDIDVIGQLRTALEGGSAEAEGGWVFPRRAVLSDEDIATTPEDELFGESGENYNGPRVLITNEGMWASFTFFEPTVCFDVDSFEDQVELPEPVRAKYLQIVDHLENNCDDLEGLAALTGPQFEASPGGGSALEVWQQEIALNDRDVIGDMVRVLQLTPAPEPDNSGWIWPAEAVILSADDDGGAFERYDGARLGINNEGVWVYFWLGGE